MMRVRVWLLAIFAALLGCACGDVEGEAAAGKAKQGSAEVGGQIVSTVEGFPITVADVKHIVDESDLTPEEALRRLQAERLLMVEAEGRGFTGDSEVAWTARQAAVQALLDQIEASAVITDADLLAAYDKAGPRFVRPELRASVHVLARLPKSAAPAVEAAAKAFIERKIAELGSAADPSAFARSLAGQRTPEFEIIAETLPPYPKAGRLDPAYASALFSLPSPGIVATPVRTSFGWHAVRVTSIEPEHRTPHEEAYKQLRPELLVERRSQLVDAAIDAARQQNGVERSANVDQVLATLPP
jgi:hypothetical protein